MSWFRSESLNLSDEIACLGVMSSSIDEHPAAAGIIRMAMNMYMYLFISVMNLCDPYLRQNWNLTPKRKDLRVGW